MQGNFVPLLLVMKKRYSHIFFDLDNTLWDFETNSKHAMKATFDELKLYDKNIGFEEFYEVYSVNNTKMWAAYRKKQIQKKELTRQRFQLTFDTLQLKTVDAQEMNDLYLKEMPKQAHLVDGAIDVLSYLKTQGYKLFIITNGFKDVQHKKLQSSGLASYFDKVFISEEIKCPKPAKGIFEYAVKSSNAKKTASIMIGDDWEVDILGAVNFGIDSVFYSQNSNPVDLQKNRKNSISVISYLNELTSLL